MALIDDPIAFPVAERLRDCLCKMLEDSLPVKCCCVWYGSEVSWDDCTIENGREGMAWVRIDSVTPTDRFPNPAATLGPCGAMDGWSVVLELGVLRCAPGISGTGALPGCDDISSAAEKAAHDAHVMRQALLCCDWREQGQRFIPGAWQPVGGDGGCHGGTMMVTVHASGCVS